MERKGKDEEPKQVQVITVEVDAEEAEKLALASTQGRLRLALRNPLNSERVLTKGANLGALLSSFRQKQAPKGASGQGEIRIEVIRGDVRKEVKF
jgi:pilus assembly protein CpaB